jgi:hypothetical protein
MVLLPGVRLLPFTVRIPEDVALDCVSCTDPKRTFPSENVTLPAGTVVPLVGLTVAVTCVVPLDAMVDGLAEAEVAVATGGAATVTDTVPVDFEKLPVGT